MLVIVTFVADVHHFYQGPDVLLRSSGCQMCFVQLLHSSCGAHVVYLSLPCMRQHIFNYITCDMQVTAGHQFG